MNDHIVEEVRKARDVYAAQFGYNLHAIVKDVQDQKPIEKYRAGKRKKNEPAIALGVAEKLVQYGTTK